MGTHERQFPYLYMIFHTGNKEYKVQYAKKSHLLAEKREKHNQVTVNSLGRSSSAGNNGRKDVGPMSAGNSCKKSASKLVEWRELGQMDYKIPSWEIINTVWTIQFEKRHF